MRERRAWGGRSTLREFTDVIRRSASRLDGIGDVVEHCRSPYARYTRLLGCLRDLVANAILDQLDDGSAETFVVCSILSCLSMPALKVFGYGYSEHRK